LADFIEWHGSSWRVVWDVPVDCRSAFGGKRRMKVNLGTDNRREAIARAGVLVARWKAECERTRGGQDKLAARAAFFRRTLEEARDTDEREVIMDLLLSEADEIDPPEPGADRTEAGRFVGLATGQLVEIKPLVDEWLKSAKIAERTKQMHRQTLLLLLADHKTVQEVDRKAASRFIQRRLVPGRQRATVERMLSGLTRFWEWLRDRGDFPDAQRSPWAGQVSQLTAEPETDKRRPFTEEEANAFVVKVNAASMKHPADLPVVMLLAVTGARLEEMAGLQGGDVSLKGDVAFVRVREGKTKAARRRIAVVAPEVVTMLRDRLPADSCRPIFSELEANEYGQVSQALSKRLGRALREITKDKALVGAHSWRHRARTYVEAASINPVTADYFFGHERPGEGLKRYSTPSDAQLMEVARAIPLPGVLVTSHVADAACAPRASSLSEAA
jgi:integrase